MKKSKFSEEQCRKHGISEPTYFVWKNKYAGMEVSQLRHLKDVVYVALKLNLPRRGKRRLPERIREPLEIPMHANHTWSADS